MTLIEGTLLWTDSVRQFGGIVGQQTSIRGREKNDFKTCNPARLGYFVVVDKLPLTCDQ